MLEIRLEGFTKLDSLGRRLKAATERKMEQLTNLMYEKVMENVSGKILQKQSGALAASIRMETDVRGDQYFGSVFVESPNEKAYALEKGGKAYYPIFPVKAELLRFVTKSGETVFAKFVNHPPSQEFAYLRTAAEEMVPIIPEGFREYIQAVLDGLE
jgi:hypothetical protein